MGSGSTELGGKSDMGVNNPFGMTDEEVREQYPDAKWHLDGPSPPEWAMVQYKVPGFGASQGKFLRVIGHLGPNGEIGANHGWWIVDLPWPHNSPGARAIFPGWVTHVGE
jgi:hypothetical protein